MTTDETFDFTRPLRGPRNVLVLEKMMSERGIVNDDKVEFNDEFVEQFYDDVDEEPGEKTMFNGNPCVWGFIYWSNLFLLAYYYPIKPSDDVKRAAYQTIDALRYLLPCKNCERHFRKNILEIPPEKYLDTRESFLEFCIELRHLVDAQLGKEQFDVDAFFKKMLACEKEDASHHQNHVDNSTSQPIESDAMLITKKTSEPVMQEQIVVDRRNIQRDGQVRVENAATATKETSHVAPKTSYGLLGRQVQASESLKTVREAMRRNGMNNQQKANLQKLARSKVAKQVEKPGECKTCGGKPKKPSVF